MLPNISDYETLFDCAYLLYKTQKAITQLPYIDPESEKISKRNSRIGVGVTGLLQAQEKWEWLDQLYLDLRQYDTVYSAKKGWSESIKISTIKPSGTLSLLAGVSPGIHPAYSHYFIRRVSISSNDPLVAYCRKKGYVVEYRQQFDGSLDRNTVVVEFPCKSIGIVSEELSAVEHLEIVKKLQTLWADNSISVTIYYKKEELPAIKEWLKENYETSIKAVSFLLHNEHGFVQAPYEEITEQEYNDLVAQIQETNLNNIGSVLLDDLECEGGVCPVR